MTRFGRIVLLLFLICHALGNSDRTHFSKTVLLKQGQSATLRMNGTNSINNIWSVQRITISANTRDYSFSIDSPDSSLFRFLSNLFGNVVNTKFLNYRILYDAIDMPSPVSYAFISPYGRSSLTIKNTLFNTDYILKVKVEFSKEFSLLYPLFLCISIILFVYAKQLYSSKVFYYIVAILFAPIIVIIYVSFSIISYAIKTNGLQVFLKVSFISILVKCVISHSFYIGLENYYLNHSLVFIIIYTICAAVSVFYVYSRLSVSTKSEVRLIYALLKIIPICLLFSVSSSLTICLTSVFAMIIIGLLSGYLKWKNIAKECSIIYHCLCFDTVSSGMDNLLSQELSESTFNMVRSILVGYKEYLQKYYMQISKQLTEYDRNEMDKFIHSDRLMFPDFRTLKLYREKINEHRLTQQTTSQFNYMGGGNNLDNTTILLDENNSRPLFGTSSSNEWNRNQTNGWNEKKDSLWNRICDAFTILFHGSSANPNPPVVNTTNQPTTSTFYNNPVGQSYYHNTQPNYASTNYNTNNWNSSNSGYRYNNGFNIRSDMKFETPRNPNPSVSNYQPTSSFSRPRKYY